MSDHHKSAETINSLRNQKPSQQSNTQLSSLLSSSGAYSLWCCCYEYLQRFGAQRRSVWITNGDNKRVCLIPHLTIEDIYEPCAPIVQMSPTELSEPTGRRGRVFNDACAETVEECLLEPESQESRPRDVKMRWFVRRLLPAVARRVGHWEDGEESGASNESCRMCLPCI